MHINRDMVELVLTIVTGVGVVLQAAVLFGILLAVRETQKKLRSLTEKLEESAVPLIHSSRTVLDDLTPKIKVITANLVSASDTLRKQAEHVGSVVNDVASRTREQTARVDNIITNQTSRFDTIITQQTSRVSSMITGTLDSIGEATAAVERGIAVPLRQVNGVLAGFKAGLETLRGNQAAVASATRRNAAPAARPAATSAVPPSVSSPITESPVAPARLVTPEIPAIPTTSRVSPASPVGHVISPNTPVEAFNEPVVTPAVTPEEAREAAARFVRDRAASERR